MALRPEPARGDNEPEGGWVRAVLEALQSNSKTARLVLIILALSLLAAAAR